MFPERYYVDYKIRKYIEKWNIETTLFPLIHIHDIISLLIIFLLKCLSFNMCLYLRLPICRIKSTLTVWFVGKSYELSLLVNFRIGQRYCLLQHTVVPSLVQVLWLWGPLPLHILRWTKWSSHLWTTYTLKRANIIKIKQEVEPHNINFWLLYFIFIIT